MNTKKVLSIVLGILMCIGGIYCMVTPIATYSTVSLVFAIVLVENAIGYFFIWNQERKFGIKDGWLLVSAILSLAGGIFLASNAVAQVIVDTAVLGVVAGFMVAMGVTRIVDAFRLKKVIEGNGWIALLLLGILSVISGIMSFMNPVALAISLGLLMAINIFLTGITLIVATYVVDYGKEEVIEKVAAAKEIVEEVIEAVEEAEKK